MSNLIRRMLGGRNTSKKDNIDALEQQALAGEQEFLRLQQLQLLQQPPAEPQPQQPQPAVVFARQAIFENPLPTGSDLDRIIENFKVPLWTRGSVDGVASAPVAISSSGGVKSGAASSPKTQTQQPQTAPFLVFGESDRAIATKINFIYSAFLNDSQVVTALKNIIRTQYGPPAVQSQQNPIDIRRKLVELYTQIIFLMKTIIIYIEHKGNFNSNKVWGMDPHVYHIWLQYMGYLESLRIILTHASSTGFIDISKYHTLESLLQESARQISISRQNVHSDQMEAIQMQGKLSERNAAIDSLNSDYAIYSGKLPLSLARYYRELGSLEHAYSVPEALKIPKDELEFSLKRDYGPASMDSYQAADQQSWDASGGWHAASLGGAYAAQTGYADGPISAESASRTPTARVQRASIGAG